MTDEAGGIGLQIELVCLANSRKPGGACVAGKNTEDGAWIRPVTADAGAVPDTRRRYGDGSSLNLMDVVGVPVLEHVPTPLQGENWLVDLSRTWTRQSTFPLGRLDELVDRPNSLWLTGFSSSEGSNDRIPEDRNDALGSGRSLYLIRTADVTIRVITPWNRPTVRGRFTWETVEYDFRVTDPVLEAEYLSKPSGEYPLGSKYITASLAEPWNGFHYKLIAAVIDPGGKS